MSYHYLDVGQKFFVVIHSFMQGAVFFPGEIPLGFGSKVAEVQRIYSKLYVDIVLDQKDA